MLLPAPQVLLILIAAYIFMSWIFAQIMDDWTAEVPRCAGEEGYPSATLT